MKAKYIAFYFILVICLVTQINFANGINHIEVSMIEVLGNPFIAETYARNVWDMQLYGNRIYLGYGNSSNSGPSPNAGPVEVYYYDIDEGKFVNEFSVDEEQIDQFKILNNCLVIPGHDSTGSWDYGNCYILNNSKWEKHHTLPNAIHVYDIAMFAGNLFAAIGSKTNPYILVSSDFGNSWSAIDENIMTPMGNRVYTLFQLKGRLYGCKLLYSTETPVNNLYCIERIEKGDKDTISCSVISANNMFPDAKKNVFYKMVRTVQFGDGILYIAGIPYNDHQFIPYALYYATDINEVKKIILPDINALPIDIITREDRAYILAYIENADNVYTNIVYLTTDGVNYHEVLRFTTDTFARSFEEYHGDFYFGLGCYADYLPESTGNILRICEESYKSFSCQLKEQLSNDGSIHLVWKVLPESPFGARYEVFRNGLLVDVVDNVSYIDKNVNDETEYTYSVCIVKDGARKIASSNNLTVILINPKSQNMPRITHTEFFPSSEALRTEKPSQSVLAPITPSARSDADASDLPLETETSHVAEDTEDLNNHSGSKNINHPIAFSLVLLFIALFLILRHFVMQRSILK